VIQAATTTPLETKTCSDCGAELPIDHFRFHHRSKGIRHSQCRSCNNDYMLLRRAKKRGKEIAAFVSKARRKRNIEQVGTVVDQMIRRFGGLEQFTAVWKAEIDLQVMSQSSSRRALDSFRTIAHLLVLCDEHRSRHEEKVEDLSDEDLERVLKESLAEL
jgi:hypothetical protein